MFYKASAPGSLMLLGEYGVLYGKHALVAAVNQRISVTLAPRSDRDIEIHSALGRFKTSISSLAITPPFRFILAVLKKYQKKLKSGCDITIESEFSDKIGFASSAAVTVALTAALFTWLEISFSDKELIESAREIIRKVQGVGSGADVAACVLGGVIAYRAKPFFTEKFSDLPALTAVYSGSKTPTADAIAFVRQYFSRRSALFKKILCAIDECALNGINAMREKDWKTLGEVMTIQQGLMDALGVNTPILNRIVNNLREKSDILGAKISGSGLGDCVIGIGAAHTDVENSIAVEITARGVECEKI